MGYQEEELLGPEGEKDTETQAGNGGHVAERRNNGAKVRERECGFCEKDEENS